MPRVGAAERLFVVDAMAGQDAVNAARAFGAALDLTGIILTKADGDARGGAALSVRQITGKPIVFIGVGEKTEALEPFDPERMASRILGMGDVVSLVEQVHRQVDHAGGAAPRPQGRQGQGLRHARPAGASSSSCRRWAASGRCIDKLPGRGCRRRASVSAEQGDRDLRRQIAIINSMTPRERRNPGIIDGSRRRRIAGGLGRAGPGRQPAAQAVPGDAAGHEEHEGRGAASASWGPSRAACRRAFPGRVRALTPGSRAARDR